MCGRTPSLCQSLRLSQDAFDSTIYGRAGTMYANILYITKGVSQAVAGLGGLPPSCIPSMSARRQRSGKSYRARRCSPVTSP